MSVFFTDTDCEMWFTDAEELGINIIGMPYTINGQEAVYDFGKNTDIQAFYNDMSAGKVATTAQAEEVCKAIRECIAEIYDTDTAEAIRIQYGGSVSADSAPELFAQENIDGGLVGGASLKPDFGKIVNYNK